MSIPEVWSFSCERDFLNVKIASKMTCQQQYSSSKLSEDVTIIYICRPDTKETIRNFIWSTSTCLILPQTMLSIYYSD